MQYLINSNAAHWFAKRNQYMAIARKNRTCLLNEWHLPLSEVAGKPNGWIAKAKRCHRIAMGFEQLADFTYNGVTRPVFVGAAHAR